MVTTVCLQHARTRKRRGVLSGASAPLRGRRDSNYFLRMGALMRFQPKSRASIDNRPGPTIVSPAAMVAEKRWPTGGPLVVKISEITTTAATAPASGVHNPMMRRSAAAASDAEAMITCNGGSLNSRGPACQRTTAPTPSRISNRPIPGQPPANVE